MTGVKTRFGCSLIPKGSRSRRTADHVVLL